MDFKKLSVVVFLLLSACALSQTDQNGNVYPPECMVEIPPSDTPITYVTRETLSGNNGKWMKIVNTPFIFIADDLEGWRKEATLRHEECHDHLWRLGLNPFWHPPYTSTLQGSFQSF